MVEAAAKAEPGTDTNLVVVKNVNTRFGMCRTTGTALIYGSAESKSIEPDYVIERHISGKLRDRGKQSFRGRESQPEESQEGDA